MSKPTQHLEQEADQHYLDKHASYYEQARHDVIRLIPNTTKRLLDVGCGNGNTGYVARKTIDLEVVYGIELFESAAIEAATKLDHVIQGDIEKMDLDLPLNHFDCILCADILEHTRDPWAVLEKLKPYLTDNGVLVASIPNIRHLIPVMKILTDRFEYEEYGILDKTHLRFFTLHTIRQMFEQSGYEIHRIETNRSRSWKFHLLNVLSLGLMRPFTITQYLLVTSKHLTK